LVTLQIGIDPQEAYRRYRIELRTDNGQQVCWPMENLTRAGSNGRRIPLSVPAGALTPKTLMK